MTKKKRIRAELARECREHAALSTARNDAVTAIAHKFLISADITGDSKLRQYALFYTGAKYN